MSWQPEGSGTRPCDCGLGTISWTSEGDDWGRMRASTLIQCPDCLLKLRRTQKAAAKKGVRREECLRQAKRIAEDRHLEAWLKTFAGLTRKQHGNG